MNDWRNVIKYDCTIWSAEENWVQNYIKHRWSYEESDIVVRIHKLRSGKPIAIHINRVAAYHDIEHGSP